MKRYCIIFKLKGGKELKWEYGNDERFGLIFERMREAVNNPAAEVVYIGERNMEMINNALMSSKGFSTYAIFSFSYRNFNGREKEKLWDKARTEATCVNVPELVDNTYTYQLIKFYYIDA